MTTEDQAGKQASKQTDTCDVDYLQNNKICLTGLLISTARALSRSSSAAAQHLALLVRWTPSAPQSRRADNAAAAKKETTYHWFVERLFGALFLSLAHNLNRHQSLPPGQVTEKKREKDSKLFSPHDHLLLCLFFLCSLFYRRPLTLAQDLLPYGCGCCLPAADSLSLTLSMSPFPLH